MKKIKFIIWPVIAVLATGIAIGCIGNDAPSPADNPNVPAPVVPPEGSTTYSFIYKKKENGYACFRIPAIVKTKANTLLAFAEARLTGCGDEGNIDLVVKRSSDNGKTWSNMQVIWHDQGNTCGNPAPVVDQNTGKIHLLMTWNLGTDAIGTINDGTSADTRRVYVTSSSDDGVTWAVPKEITTDVKKPEWGWYATGPCHGIQLTKGDYAGRLVIPCDNIELKSKGGRGHAHLIYSDDAGATWKLGGVTPYHSQLNPNESAVAELSNGHLLLNCRCSNNNNLRVISKSEDGGHSLSAIETAYGFIDPVCQGSLLSGTIGGQHTLFFSNPASTTRTNMTLKMSTDNGATWSKRYVVHTGPSGYSDIVLLSDTQIGVFFEAGAASDYRDGIAFQAVNIIDFY
jgi:sialidase-1